MQRICKGLVILACLIIPGLALAAGDSVGNLHLVGSVAALLAPLFFVMAYALVMAEEFIHLRKSKPVVIAAGLIWILIAILSQQKGVSEAASLAVKHSILEYAELFMFLLAAMTYINAMEERNVFEALRAWLVRKSFNYRQLFWITGILSFFISPIADNLSTALLMCAVVLAVGKDNLRFITIGCVNIVVAANAGGAFSPFGDITTLMVWQKGILNFIQFFHIFVPSVVSYIIPAVIMHFAVPKAQPAVSDDLVQMKYGATWIIGLFLLTIFTAISFHTFLHLPPMLGMMTGLGYLQFYAFYLKKAEPKLHPNSNNPEFQPFDIFRKVKQAEWDTLLFFYGIIMCVGGLATMGYLDLVSKMMYHDWGAALSAAHSATPANVAVGFLSALVDNIPVMFAVLTMQPSMSEGQWLLVTLTAGIGGSMLSIGSAAGVALMGQAKGKYTFFGHLKWAWVIMLGYVVAILCHYWLNANLFSGTIT